MATFTTQHGTLSISDLLAVNNTSIIDYGRQDVFKILRNYFIAYSRIVDEMRSMFCAVTKERVVGTGNTPSMVMQYVDEFGVTDAQKVGGPTLMGFPLRMGQVSLQWTYQWMKNHTPAEMAAQAQAAAIADMQKVQSAIRTAIFYPTNTTFTDRLRDNMAIPVKAFANADSFPIPAGPNGDTFNAATHNHYLGTTNAQPTPSDINTLLSNVTEHSAGKPYLFVPQGVGDYIYANRVATYTEFAPFTYDTQQYSNQLTLGRGVLDPSNPTNRPIGVYRGATVWIKPWMPTTAIWAWVDGPQKPLAFRVPDTLNGTADGEFGPIFDDDQYPTMCQIMARTFGLAPQDRVAGAVLSFGGADTVYVTPSGL